MRTIDSKGVVAPAGGKDPKASETSPTLVHLYIRGNYRQDIFFDKVDFINAWNRIWLSALATNIEILAVQILSNHLHLCLRIHPRANSSQSGTKLGGPRLSNFVHHLRMSLSFYFNRRYNVHGSLGSRRYCSAEVTPIDEDRGDDLRDLIRYIIRNPKHHKISDNYQDWLSSTYKFVFGLDEDIPSRPAKDTPRNLLKAYFPATCNLPENWTITSEGLLTPPSDIFPREYIEELFSSRRNYIKACDTTTRRESEHEKNEDKLGFNSARITDQEIMDYIQECTLFPIVSLTKEQCLIAAQKVKKDFPKVSFRQLSRILHIPSSTIHHNLGQS